MKLQHVKSSFPLAVGAEISAVDNDCFSATGKPYSFIALADAESSNERTLQEDDVRCNSHAAPPSRAPLLLTCLSLVYRFRLHTNLHRSFPGYAALFEHTAPSHAPYSAA